MKLLNRILFLLIFISTAVFAQESSFYDAPFGGGGGYVGGWIIPNVNGINTELKNFGVPNLPSSGFYTSGGAGFIYLGIIKNLRIGGMGFGGSFSTSGSSTVLIPSGSPSGPVKIVPVNNEAIYSLNGGGLTVEYTLPFVKEFGISLGAIIGRGSFNIELDRNVGGMNWQDYWSAANNYPTLNFSSSLKNSYWIFSPTLNVDIPAYRLLAFRVGMGYQVTFGSHWSYDNNKDIYNAPSNINGNSFFIQAGIFVGLFSF
jgi:hypothetical protein